MAEDTRLQIVFSSVFLGSGLGKDETGITEPIKAKIKHDTRGVCIVKMPRFYNIRIDLGLVPAVNIHVILAGLCGRLSDLNKIS